MACPWFLPDARADLRSRPQPARAPLGSVFGGQCHARPDHPIHPPETLLYEGCNFGNGRGHCPWFPADSDFDAVRFSPHAGGYIWILERDHEPLAHGSFDEAMPSLFVARQAEVYRERLCTLT